MSSISRVWQELRKVWQELHDKEYRDGYTEAQLSIEVPFQIRALRTSRGWTQAQLAERTGIPQARISHVEQPGRDPLSLRTLYRIASAFDVGLLVQFVSFSELVQREAAFDPNTFYVPSFQEDRLETVSTSTTWLFSRNEFTLKIEQLGWVNERYEMEAWSIHAPESNTKSALPLDRERTKYGYETQSTGVYSRQSIITAAS